MKLLKQIGSSILCLLCFVAIFFAIVFVTDIAFNKTTTFTKRYEDFNYGIRYEVQK